MPAPHPSYACTHTRHLWAPHDHLLQVCQWPSAIGLACARTIPAIGQYGVLGLLARGQIVAKKCLLQRAVGSELTDYDGPA